MDKKIKKQNKEFMRAQGDFLELILEESFRLRDRFKTKETYVDENLVFSYLFELAKIGLIDSLDRGGEQQ